MVKLINAVNSPLNIEVLVGTDINDVDSMFLWEDNVTKIPLHSELIKLHKNTAHFFIQCSFYRCE
jgi:transcriptional regulator